MAVYARAGWAPTEKERAFFTHLFNLAAGGKDSITGPDAVRPSNQKVYISRVCALQLIPVP